ncbi:ABC transporter permease [Nocardiopsis alba]|jgi:peptide/nickel transport system permease protein|uniref:ABC transporter permease n=2 Tax=Nocardiopsis alba TaxID=53437 RepID=A0A7K2IXL7_9ACTN|nr:ABC transporter permease [Nocardiopsis alba]AFR09879.1 binding--dependent transport system inner membrane component family protein [Nocardiopsis alba ATCC BAA-2165]MYR34596.1 ABC transporter permease subunit [Nocardiopsis alba]
MRYVLRRVGQAVVVLFAAFTAAFVLLQAMPGDAVMIRFENPELGLSPEQIAALREAYGVDVPAHRQFLHTLLGFLRGDFGYSVQSGTPVSRMIAEALPGTLLLASLGFVVAVILAVGIAFLSTYPRLSWIRGALRALPSLFVSVPVFWLGILLVQVFSFRLGLVSVIAPGPVEGLILPVLTLAVPISAPLAQILVRSIDEVYTRPFVTVVRARGASHHRVLWRDVAGNALLPALTMAGVLFGELIGGAVVTETVFGRAGLGRLTEQAVGNQDVAVLQAVVLLTATVFVLINLCVDLLYPLLDPRLRTKAGAAA